MSDLRIGFALCGSFCTYDKAFEVLERLSEKYEDITPIMSEKSYVTDTRFGTAEGFVKRAEEICGKKVIRSIVEAEPIGPKAILDILVIAPCTGNTIAKLAQGITDSSITMAAKAQLRNERPVLLAVSTNDGLSGSAANIGTLLCRKNVYFVPFRQDDPMKKPRSLVADFDLIPDAIEAAAKDVQLQPILC